MKALKSTSLTIVGMVVLFTVGVLVNSSYAKIDPETAVGIYLFDEEKVNEITDHSGKGNNGIFVGGNGKWEDGKFGLALNIIEGGWVSVESNDMLHPVDAWTVVAWFNTESIPGDVRMIVLKENEYCLWVDGNLSAFVRPGGNWEPRANAGVPKTETWVHAALVWDNEENGALRVYMDGVQAAQQARPGKIAATENPLCIGDGRGQIWNGLLDEFGIFNVALSEEDINSIMTEGLQVAVFGRAAVEFTRRLTTTWASIKARY